MSGLIRLLTPGSGLAWVALILEALAWPLAAVIITAILRAEFRLVVERLARLKYRDFEAEFRDELDRVEGLAGVNGTANHREDLASSTRLIDLPRESRRILHEVNAPSILTDSIARWEAPRRTITSAWSSLLSSAERTSGTTGLDPAHVLAARSVLDGPGLLAFERLRRLHAAFCVREAWEPSAELARRFAAIAGRLRARIDAGG